MNKHGEADTVNETARGLPRAARHYCWHLILSCSQKHAGALLGALGMWLQSQRTAVDNGRGRDASGKRAKLNDCKGPRAVFCVTSRGALGGVAACAF